MIVDRITVAKAYNKKARPEKRSEPEFVYQDFCSPGVYACVRYGSIGRYGPFMDLMLGLKPISKFYRPPGVNAWATEKFPIHPRAIFAACGE